MISIFLNMQRDHSENITGGVEAFQFLQNPDSPLQELAESGCPLRQLAESGSPYIYVHIFLITPLYVFYGLIWAISVFLIISISQNLPPPPPLQGFRRMMKSGNPPSKASTPPPIPSTSNVFWSKFLISLNCLQMPVWSSCYWYNHIDLSGRNVK